MVDIITSIAGMLLIGPCTLLTKIDQDNNYQINKDDGVDSSTVDCTAQAKTQSYQSSFDPALCPVRTTGVGGGCPVYVHRALRSARFGLLTALLLPWW